MLLLLPPLALMGPLGHDIGNNRITHINQSITTSKQQLQNNEMQDKPFKHWQSQKQQNATQVHTNSHVHGKDTRQGRARRTNTTAHINIQTARATIQKRQNTGQHSKGTDPKFLAMNLSERVRRAKDLRMRAPNSLLVMS